MSKICRTFAADLRNMTIMKMYKNPKTDVQTVQTEYMMQGSLIVSVNQGGNGGGVAGAPARQGGEVID